MAELETSHHLFQPAVYHGPGGGWVENFRDAIANCGTQVTLDVSAVASVLSFGMVGLNRTLIKEITRRPWMSRIDDKGKVIKELPAPHGFFTASDSDLAQTLFRLLCDEARAVCQGYSPIYILLSGGLDSRIVGGVLSYLYRIGDLAEKPIAVTWGLSDSRDVIYAHKLAALLDFEWVHIPFGPETVLENIDTTVQCLGLLHSPEMLHNISWFKNVPDTSLVLAGSFGDSIGRAEFAGLHLLQLKEKKPNNAYGLLKPDAFDTAKEELQNDLDAIHHRGRPDLPAYARNELWMQGFRMRGGLCHGLTLINQFARVYQMFTAPQVYSFMWSLHPARRDDDIYAAILKNHMPEIARVPWPRTNRALRGPTEGARKELRPHYHEYTKWSSGALYDDLSQRVDPEWFESIGVFDPANIQRMRDRVRCSSERVGRLNDIWLWLAGFRSFVECIDSMNKKLLSEPIGTVPRSPNHDENSKSKEFGVYFASKLPAANVALKTLRDYKRKANLNRLKYKALRAYPPVK